MSSLDRLFRRLVPAVPRLSHARWLMFPLDALDRALCWPWRELRALPPNRFRIRVGVGNRLLFNGAHFVQFPVNFWLDAFNSGAARTDANILDLGCGCGRFARVLRDFRYHGREFGGRYTGVDIDGEMLRWCREHFPAHRFAWIDAGMSSSVYNPGAHAAARTRLDVPDSSQDFVLSNSLFTHLMETDFAWYFAEVGRVLRPGGHFQFSALIIEDVHARERESGAPGRWSFPHRRGRAWIESERYPEAAVAYERAFVEQTWRESGLVESHTFATDHHTVFRLRRAPESAA